MNCKKKTLRAFAAPLLALVIGSVVARPALAGSYDNNDFLVANFNSGNVAIYDENLNFKSYLDSSFPQATAIDLLSNGNAVVAGENGECRIYNPAGVLLGTFTDDSLGGVIDIKATTEHLYAATLTTARGIQEFGLTGTPQRIFGARVYSGNVVLPNGELWGSTYNDNPKIVDRFDLTSGNALPSFSLDNGQENCLSMRYSASTGTVLMSGIGADDFFERTTAGAFVRKFALPISAGESYGITRGPGGKVYATDYGNSVIYTWQANGTFIGSTATAPVGTGPCNMTWTGNLNVVPANVISGIVIERGLFIAAEPLPGRAGLRKQVQFVTLKNKSGAAINGPVYLALDNLNRATLTNGTGFTDSAPIGSPYIAVNVGNDNVFSVNEKVTVQLNFTPTTFGTITYNTRVLAGSGTP